MTDDTVPIRRSRVVSPENLPCEMPEVIERIALKARTRRAGESWGDGPIPVKHELEKRGLDTPFRATMARILPRNEGVTAQSKKRSCRTRRRDWVGMLTTIQIFDAHGTLIAIHPKATRGTPISIGKPRGFLATQPIKHIPTARLGDTTRADLHGSPELSLV